MRSKEWNCDVCFSVPERYIYHYYLVITLFVFVGVVPHIDADGQFLISRCMFI